jgi:hypothetical protein
LDRIMYPEHYQKIGIDIDDYLKWLFVFLGYWTTSECLGWYTLDVVISYRCDLEITGVLMATWTTARWSHITTSLASSLTFKLPIRHDQLMEFQSKHW